MRSSSRSREQVFVLLNCCYFIVMLSNLKFFVSFFISIGIVSSPLVI